MRNSWIFPVLFFMMIFGSGGMFSGLLFPLIIFFIIYKSVIMSGRQFAAGLRQDRAVRGCPAVRVIWSMKRWAVISARMKNCRFWKKSACVRKRQNILDCGI